MFAAVLTVLVICFALILSWDSFTAPDVEEPPDFT